MVTTNSTRRTIEQLITNYNIHHDTPKKTYTYINLAHMTRSCLDLCFSSSNMATDVKVIFLKEQYIGSDHLPLKIEFHFNPEKSKTQFRRKWEYTPEKLAKFTAIISPSKITIPDFSQNLV